MGGKLVKRGKLDPLEGAVPHRLSILCENVSLVVDGGGLRMVVWFDVVPPP